MTPFQIYTERAAECRREADATPLVNVRKRCLSSAAAWQQMANRAQQSEVYRASEVERKAEEQRMRGNYDTGWYAW